MSKTTSYSDAKPYSNGNFSINGKTKATTNKSSGTVYGNYYMDEYEKALYDYAQKTLSEVVPNVNVFSADTMKNIQSQLNTYKNQGQNAINQIYTPMINNLKNDIASRFGNLDNSMFMNNLNNIEKNRSNSIAELAENLILKQNDLVNNELSNRYNFINLLNNIQNQSNSNAFNMMSTALGLGNSGANYANSYPNYSGSYTNPSNSLSNSIDLKTLASLASMISLFV